MPEEVRIDGKLFEARLSAVFSRWSEDCDSLIVVAGRHSDDVNESKSLAVHNYLFGVEFTDTILVFDRSAAKLRVLASSKKLALLSNLANVQTFTRPDDASQNVSVFTSLLSGLSRPASLRKETHAGDFASAFTTFEASRFPEAVSAVTLLSEIFSVKDAAEIENVKRAAQVTGLLLKSGLIREVEDAIEKGERVSHKKLVGNLDKLLDSKDFQKKLVSKLGNGSPDSASMCDIVYSLVQSGDNFSLRPDAVVDSEKLTPRCVVVAVGGKYREYSANCVRTLFVDPDSVMTDVYEAVCKSINFAIANIRPGRAVTEVHAEILAHLTQGLEAAGISKDAISKGVTRDFGSGIGLEFRDSAFVLNSKNNRKFVENSVLNLSIGVSDLLNSKNQKFAVWIADTLLLQSDSASVFTAAVSRAKDEISYSLEPDDLAPDAPESADDSGEEEEERGERPAPVVRRVGTRRRGAEEEEAERKKLAERQEALRQQKAEEIRTRYLGASDEILGEEGSAGTSSSSTLKRFDEYQSGYGSMSSIQGGFSRKRVHLDVKNGCVLIPISGDLVPFHLRLVKTVTKPGEEGGNSRVSQLRIVFHTPNLGGFGAGGVDAALFPRLGERSLFVKEISVQAEDGKSLSSIFRGIKEAQKKLKEEDAAMAAAAAAGGGGGGGGLLGPLKLVRDRPKPVLRDLNVKPQTGPQGRSKAVGVLEAHENGFRFTGGKSESVDILYKNIEHAIFQPCEVAKDNVVLLHFRLREGILVGKKKTTDIQFYTETRSQGDDLNQRRRAGYDPDEILDEQREREMIAKINKLFKDFVKKVEEEHGRNIEFDMPYRELGFHGTPGKSSVDIFPCQNSVVALNEWPAFVYSLKNLEIVYFERISYGLKNFDMVFVDKDLSKTNVVRISAIPVVQLEQIKAWLSEIEVVFYEGPTNLNWPNILKEIAKDKKGFGEAGGWHSYFADSEGEEDDDEDDEDSDFSDEESDDSDEDEDESDYSDDDSDDSSLESESEAGSDFSEESEGLSWDELEKKAAKEDRKRGREDSDDEGRSKKKKRK